MPCGFSYSCIYRKTHNFHFMQPKIFSYTKWKGKKCMVFFILAQNIAHLLKAFCQKISFRAYFIQRFLLYCFFLACTNLPNTPLFIAKKHCNSKWRSKSFNYCDLLIWYNPQSWQWHFHLFGCLILDCLHLFDSIFITMAHGCLHATSRNSRI